MTPRAQLGEVLFDRHPGRVPTEACIRVAPERHGQRRLNPVDEGIQSKEEVSMGLLDKITGRESRR